MITPLQKLPQAAARMRRALWGSSRPDDLVAAGRHILDRLQLTGLFDPRTVQSVHAIFLNPSRRLNRATVIGALATGANQTTSLYFASGNPGLRRVGFLCPTAVPSCAGQLGLPARGVDGIAVLGEEPALMIYFQRVGGRALSGGIHLFSRQGPLPPTIQEALL